MAHHLDRSVGSDLSYRVFELRRQRGELGAASLNTNHQLFNVPSLIANRRRFVADVEEGSDNAQPVPLSVAVGERER